MSRVSFKPRKLLILGFQFPAKFRMISATWSRTSRFAQRLKQGQLGRDVSPEPLGTHHKQGSKPPAHLSTLATSNCSNESSQYSEEKTKGLHFFMIQIMPRHKNCFKSHDSSTCGDLAIRSTSSMEQRPSSLTGQICRFSSQIR